MNVFHLTAILFPADHGDVASLSPTGQAGRLAAVKCAATLGRGTYQKIKGEYYEDSYSCPWCDHGGRNAPLDQFPSGVRQGGPGS